MGEGWLVLVASLAAVTTGQSSKPKPNFLHILLDDWGIGDVNAYGNRDTTKVQTPSIDALAAEGVLFTQGYSASPVCSPSRTAWMTSRFPAEAGIHSALGGGCGGCAQFLDPAKFVPITKLLSDAGWRTAHFGKVRHPSPIAHLILHAPRSLSTCASTTRVAMWSLDLGDPLHVYCE
eukprot:m.146284 g.146284  ORF g.146284 m.146284 type:complete len:177 (-) comp23098_c0_seq2:153-683(-)